MKGEFVLEAEARKCIITSTYGACFKNRYGSASRVPYLEEKERQIEKTSNAWHSEMSGKLVEDIVTFKSSNRQILSMELDCCTIAEVRADEGERMKYSQ